MAASTLSSSEAIRSAWLPVCLIKNTGRLASLWDIVNRFNLFQFCSVFSNLMAMESTYAILRKQGAEPGPATDEVLKEVSSNLSTAKDYFQSVRFMECLYTVTMTIEHIKRDWATMTNFGLETDLRHIIEMMLKESHTRGVFLMLDKEAAGFIDNPKLFGETVKTSFPSAVGDIEASGNCIATGCHTAAVFHLMRVAEYGLRALARDRRAKVPRGEILLSTWEEIIRELEKAEQAIQGYPKTLAREAQFEFYHGAMMEFRRFKNVFRNRVSHTREDYDVHQARSAFDHVGSFMKILASRISETTRTPRVWRGKKWNDPV